MVSTRDFRDLMRVANERGFERVMFQGDIKQLEAVGAGVPYKQLQRAGMATVLMDDVLRHDNENQRASVLHAVRGEVRAAFEKLHGVIEKDDVARGTADAWLALSKTERAHTGVIIPTNKRRREVNDLIRAGLKADGTLSRKSIVLPTIDPLDATRAMAGDARSYRPGDTILSVGAIKTYRIAPYSLFSVLARDEEANVITLRPEAGGRDITVKLGQNTQAAEKLVAFQEAPREFAAGERVKFNLADRDIGILKGETGTLTKLSRRTATVALDSGQTVRVDTNSFAGRGLDHAYALTAHAFQGDDTKDIIAGISSREFLATQKALYVAISRARTHATIVTDDRDRLIRTISEKTGESMEALTEVTRQRLRDLGSTQGFTQPLPEAVRGITDGMGAQARSGAQRTSEGPGRPEEKVPEKGTPQTPQNDPNRAEKTDLKTGDKTTADRAREHTRSGAKNGAPNETDRMAEDPVREDLEKRWEKFAEDRARGRDERSR